MHILQYPIICGELPKLEPVIEYHLVTPRGALACTFEKKDKDLAVKRWSASSKGSRLIEVTRRFKDVTPSDEQVAQAA